MEIATLESFCSLTELEENSLIVEQDIVKNNLEQAAAAIAQFCSEKLTKNLNNIDLKDIKELAKLSFELYKIKYAQSGINITNIQQNISNTQLNFFKDSLKDEI